MKKALGILGIDHPDTSKLWAIEEYCKIDLITGQDQETLVENALRAEVPFVVTEKEEDFKSIDEQLWENDTKTYAGEDAIAQCCENENLTHIWINYKNLTGLKAAVFALKAKKIVGIHSLDLLFQCGHLLKEVALENSSLIMSTDSEINFFYQTILRYNIEDISAINLTFSSDENDVIFKKCIALRKLCTSMPNINFQYFKSESNTSFLEFYFNNGEVITHQKECIPFSILNQWFKIPQNKKPQTNQFCTIKRQNLNWKIDEAWYNNDALAIDFLNINDNWSTFQENNNTASTKIKTIEDVRNILTTSSRTDLDS